MPHLLPHESRDLPFPTRGMQVQRSAREWRSPLDGLLKVPKPETAVQPFFHRQAAPIVTSPVAPGAGSASPAASVWQCSCPPFECLCGVSTATAAATVASTPDYRQAPDPCSMATMMSSAIEMHADTVFQVIDKILSVDGRPPENRHSRFFAAIDNILQDYGGGSSSSTEHAGGTQHPYPSMAVSHGVAVRVREPSSSSDCLQHHHHHHHHHPRPPFWPPHTTGYPGSQLQ
ncbi:hypothetical protein HPB49_005966 [Dermacentor silvarum]|uniref:Uncharacterized protein n=1 Tax=Dermacentor silvarum TaxID=543639 RepID=A0ACB8DNS8_DERSI|nr:hypothetical protein HPB49_005966 [Dermacentor silvarum]